MKLRILAFFICILVVSGCASRSEITLIEFPESYGPLEYDEELMGKINEIYKDKPSLKRQGLFAMPQLRSLARKTRKAPVAVFECDPNVIKAFIASDWVPIIIIGLPREPKRINAVLSYDDSTREFTIVDSEDNSRRKLKYARLFNMLIGPQRACILMFSRYTGPASIRRALKNYIPEEKAEKIPIMTPRDK